MSLYTNVILIHPTVVMWVVAKNSPQAKHIQFTIMKE